MSARRAVLLLLVTAALHACGPPSGGGADESPGATVASGASGASGACPVATGLGPTQAVALLAGDTQQVLVSRTEAGAQILCQPGERFPGHADISGDASLGHGRRGRVVFSTGAVDVAAGPNVTGHSQVYVRDLGRQHTLLVSGLDPHPSGVGRANHADGESDDPQISADGRWVVFTSGADDLSDDGSTEEHVWLFDADTQALVRVSENLDTGAAGDGASRGPDISGDGRRIVFVSRALNLTSGAVDTAPVSCGETLPVQSDWNVWLLDRGAGASAAALTLLSVGRVDGPNGATCVPADGPSAAPAIARDGCRIAFQSLATNLDPQAQVDGASTQIWAFDGASLRLVSRAHDAAPGWTAGGDGPSYDPQISADGRFVGFLSDASDLVPGDLNGAPDVFVHDLELGVTVRVNKDDAGVVLDGGQWRGPFLSPTGRFVAWATLDAAAANGQAAVYLHDRAADAGIAAFDLVTRTEVVALSAGGGPANGSSAPPAQFTDDGQWLVYTSLADDLASPDPDRNGQNCGSPPCPEGQDVYVRRVWAPIEP